MSRKVVDKTGEVTKSSSGMLMKIIAFRRSDDIDVQFEDGSVATNKTYTNFKKGNIKPPINKVGEVNRAKNGMLMEIIAYRNCNDIDIRFEDGAIVRNRSYRKFKDGKVGHPDKFGYNKERDAEIRVGEENVNKKGEHLKIICYRNSKDIDVQFEDGTILKGKSYDNFKKGLILKPVDLKENRVGEESISKEGMKMKIINYRGATDIDVKFEDGTILYGKTYYNFKNGLLSVNSLDKYEKANARLGKNSIASNGMKMIVIAYRSSTDMDVQFEDGYIAHNVNYYNFKKGTIKNPNNPVVFPERRKDFVGKRFKQNNGKWVEIIRYENGKVDIKFDDGVVVKGKNYRNVKEGKIGYPGQNLRMDRLIENRVGQTVQNKNGELMTLVAYRGFNDIDIQFADGTVAEHRTYVSFRDGKVDKPTYCRLGEESVATNGMKIKIIEYRNAGDIDIQFEDGVVLQHKQYSSFKRGSIAHPQKNILLMSDRYKDKILYTQSGIRFKVINYVSSTDVEIMFEDGLTKKVQLNNMKRGGVAHPQFNKSTYAYNFYDFSDIKRAYSVGNEVFYTCVDNNGNRTIATPQMMMELSGVEKVF